MGPPRRHKPTLVPPGVGLVKETFVIPGQDLPPGSAIISGGLTEPGLPRVDLSGQIQSSLEQTNFIL